MVDLAQYQTDAGFLADGDGIFLKNDAGIHRSSAVTGKAATAVTLTSAQILALNTTPVTIIPAAGAGTVIIPRLVELFYDYGTAAYGGIASGEDLVLRYTDGSGNVIMTAELTGFIDQTSNQYRILANFGTLATGINHTITPTANAAVVAHFLSGNVTTGDGTVTIKVHEYDVITLAS